MVDTAKMRRLVADPEPERAHLSGWAAAKTWFASNRMRIGMSLLSLFALLRVVLHFEGHNELIDFLKTLVDLFLVGSAATASAGAFKSDQFWRDKAEASLPPQRIDKWGDRR